ncbi:hypothetical protein A9R05_27300 [Burkholderia sp. KK1]|nr:hypothetical protein A9R05_27300 [Burkholderia sp. KK1]
MLRCCIDERGEIAIETLRRFDERRLSRRRMELELAPRIRIELLACAMAGFACTRASRAP